MKRTILVLSAFVFILASFSFSQQPPIGPRGNCRPMMQKMNFLQLTEKQQQQIDKMRLEFQKEVLPLRDKVQSLRNEFKLMIVDEKVSKSGLKKQLEKISAAKQEMALKRAQHQREVRKLLTDDQKVKFDQHIISGHKGGKRGAFHKGPGKMGRPHRAR